MKVLCIKLISPADGSEMDESAWVRLHAEYTVVSVTATPNGRIQFQIPTDDRQSLGWFDSEMFVTVDSSLPPNWIVKVGDGGGVDLGPAPWLATGFWEAYYDDDQGARRTVEDELQSMLEPQS